MHIGSTRPIASFATRPYDLTLQIAGHAAAVVTTVRRDTAENAFLLFHLDRDGRLVAASGLGTGNTVARDIRLAEMLINERARPDIAALSSPEIRLKSLVAA